MHEGCVVVDVRMPNGLITGIRDLLRDERGAQTVEFVLWVPLIAAMVTLVVDTATLYRVHAEMWAVARDTARRMSSGQITTELAAENYAASMLFDYEGEYTIDATYDAANMMQVVISIAHSDASVIGYGTHTIFGGEMSARVAMKSDTPVNLNLNLNGGGNGGGNGN
ncbi:MAG: hypothetical protein GTN90_09985 [Xanthomonadales bacterium]|nr:hypothetical protein [Xanthomonadales bacterium]